MGSEMCIRDSLKYRQDYLDIDPHAFEKTFRDERLSEIQHAAKDMGYTLAPLATASAGGVVAGQHRPRPEAGSIRQETIARCGLGFF